MVNPACLQRVSSGTRITRRHMEVDGETVDERNLDKIMSYKKNPPVCAKMIVDSRLVVLQKRGEPK